MQVRSLIDGHITDVDAAGPNVTSAILSQRGIAITGATAANGTWQFEAPGAVWTDLGPVSDTSALLLTPDDTLRFCPDGTDGTAATLTFRAWDQSSGAGFRYGKVDVSSNGGVTPYSAQSATAHIPVIPLKATTALSLSAAGIYGTGATLSAALLANGNPLAAALVSFARSDGTPLGTAITNSSGVATLTGVSIVGLDAGTYPNAFIARFAGDANDMASSASATLVISPAATSTSLVSSSPGSAAYGQAVKFTATVAAGLLTPVGQVQFYVNGAPLGSPQALNAAGQASLTTSTLSLGANSITVSYLGNIDFLPSSTTAPLTQQAIAGIVLLDASARGALSVTGNGSVDVINGSIVVDSSNSSAILATGNGVISATIIDVDAHAATTGNAQIDGSIQSGHASVADPLASLSGPDPATLSVQSRSTLQIGGTMTLKPGVYIGGIKIGGNANVTLSPGIYYMQGGGFSVSGNATVSDLGQGVMIYNAPASAADTLSFTGNGKVNLSPIKSGVYQGLLLFQSRSSTAAISINGNDNLNLSGTIYAAGALLSITGNGEIADTDNPVDKIGSSIIVDELAVSGNGSVVLSE